MPQTEHACAAAQMPLYDGPVIDAHHHFWDPVLNHHPWLSAGVNIPFRYGDYSAIKRKYFPEEYFNSARAHHVSATVYVETEWDPADPLGETAFITAIARQYGAPNAVVAQAWLHHPDAADTIAAQAAYPLVRSVRHKPGGADCAQHAHSQPSLMDDAQWRKGFEQLAVHGLHFDLQTPWWHLDAAVRLARDFPQTLLILNHAGLPSDRSASGIAAWRDAMGALAECPNVAVKVSGLGQRDTPWTQAANEGIVQACIDLFSPQRILFASNFPVDSLCASFDTIFTGFKRMVAHMSPAEQRDMFHDNAARIYRPVASSSLLDTAIQQA